MYFQQWHCNTHLSYVHSRGDGRTAAGKHHLQEATSSAVRAIQFLIFTNFILQLSTARHVAYKTKCSARRLTYVQTASQNILLM
jgi:hypothetical protein